MLCINEHWKVFEMFCAKRYGVVLVHLHDILQLYSCIIHATRYKLAYMCLTPSTRKVQSDENGEARLRQHRVVPVHRSASKIIKSLRC